MSHHDDNLYTILDRLAALQPKPEIKTSKEIAKQIYESVEARGSILSGVDTVQARLAKQFAMEGDESKLEKDHCSDCDCSPCRCEKCNECGMLESKCQCKPDMTEGGKTSKQLFWDPASQSTGPTPVKDLTYADPDEDGVHYPDYANTKFQPRAKPTQAKPTQANKRLTNKQYAKQLHKTYAPLYDKDKLRITFNRRKNIFSVKGNNGLETDYIKYRVDPTTNELKRMNSTNIDNESINPGVAEGHCPQCDCSPCECNSMEKSQQGVAEAMPNAGAEYDDPATYNMAQQITAAIEKMTAAKSDINRGDTPGTYQIVVNPSVTNNTRGYGTGQTGPGASVANISAAVGPYMNQFRAKGWMFTQPMQGQFTIGIPKQQGMTEGHCPECDCSPCECNSMEESAFQAAIGKKKYGDAGMKALQKAGREHAGAKTMSNIRNRYDKYDESQSMADEGDVTTHKGTYGTEYQGEPDDDDDKPKQKVPKVSNSKTGKKGRPTGTGKNQQTTGRKYDHSALSSILGGSAPKNQVKGKVHKMDESVDQVARRLTEGVNLLELLKEKHQTVDEMLAELSTDIANFKESGHCSELLKDCMDIKGAHKKDQPFTALEIAPARAITPAATRLPHDFNAPSMDRELNELARLAGLSEDCGDMPPIGITMQDMQSEQDNLSISTTYNSRDGKKTISVNADGKQAEDLLQMLRIAGLGGGEKAQELQARPEIEFDNIDGEMSMVPQDDIEELSNEQSPMILGGQYDAEMDEAEFDVPATEPVNGPKPEYQTMRQSTMGPGEGDPGEKAMHPDRATNNNGDNALSTPATPPTRAQKTLIAVSALESKLAAEYESIKKI